MAMAALGALACLYVASPALAATITTVSRDDVGARTLAEAMVRDPEQLRGARFSTVPPSGTPHGTSGTLSFFPTHGERVGIMTTGNALFAGAENTQPNSGQDLGGRAVRSGATPRTTSASWSST